MWSPLQTQHSSDVNNSIIAQKQPTFLPLLHTKQHETHTHTHTLIPPSLITGQTVKPGLKSAMSDFFKGKIYKHHIHLGSVSLF